jgi:hypothetical protein
MRFVRLLLAALFLCGMCLAQDSNFSSGPQYLMNFGSPSFLHSIETPSLSLEPTVTAPATEPRPEEQPVPASIGTGIPDLFNIYYGPPPETLPKVASEASEIELSSPSAAPPLPASFFEVGVIEITTSHSLSELGYGLGVAETAAFWKSHKPSPPHIYTNADIQRLHGG